MKKCWICGENEALPTMKYCQSCFVKKIIKSVSITPPKKGPGRTRNNTKNYNLYSIYDNCCAICGWRLENSETTYGLHIHHITPVSEGGISERENLIVLCPNHHVEAHRGILEREDLFRMAKDHLEKYAKEFLSRYKPAVDKLNFEKKNF